MFSDTLPLGRVGQKLSKNIYEPDYKLGQGGVKTRDRFKRIFCGNFPFKNVLKPLIHSSKLIPFTLSSLKSLESNVRNVIPACKSCPQWCRWWSGGVCGRTSGTLNDPSWRWGRPLPDIGGSTEEKTALLWLIISHTFFQCIMLNIYWLLSTKAKKDQLTIVSCPTWYL